MTLFTSPIPLHEQAKAIFMYQKEEKLNFPNSRAILLISVGQVAHEGAKLAATVELANKNFYSCDVAVCDVLQRHTMQIDNDFSLEEIYIKSSIEGQKWLMRNKGSLKLLKIPHKIFCWEEYFLRPDFNAYKEKIILTYENDEEFKNAMDQTIEEFIKRREHRLTEVQREKVFECCFNYLIEESAVMMLMWPECQYHYIIYPGNMPKILNVARNKFVVPVNPKLLKWLTVYVRTRAIYKQSSQISTPDRIMIVEDNK